MASTTHYCTYFDHRYLPRGLALYASLRRHCKPFCLWALCLSDECYDVMNALALPDVIPLRLAQLEHYDSDLLRVKGSRSLIEYYFTCTAALIAWLLTSQPAIDILTYLDADLFFFSSPRTLFDEFSTYSTLIVPHHVSERNHGLLSRGIYNVGWVSFRRDEDGLAALGWWREVCIDWCYDRVEPDRYADQKYLDRFPEKFSRVLIGSHIGLNVGPWNLDRYNISAGPRGIPMANGQPIVYFHFSKLSRVAPFFWGTNHRHYGAPMGRDIRKLIYAPYIAEVVAAERLIRRHLSRLPPPILYGERVVARHSLSAKVRHILALLVRGGGLCVIGQRVL